MLISIQTLRTKGGTGITMLYNFPTWNLIITLYMTAASKERCLKDSRGQVVDWSEPHLLCGKQAKITVILKSHSETSEETHKKYKFPVL